MLQNRFLHISFLRVNNRVCTESVCQFATALIGIGEHDLARPRIQCKLKMNLSQGSAAEDCDRFARTIVDSVCRVDNTRYGFGKGGHFIIHSLGYRVHAFFRRRTILRETSVPQHAVGCKIVAEAWLMVAAPITFSAALIRIADNPLPRPNIFFFLMIRQPPTPTLLPYTTLCQLP